MVVYNISLENGLNANFSVFNINGQKVFETHINESAVINADDLPLGIYTFRITSDSFIETEKVILK